MTKQRTFTDDLTGEKFELAIPYESMEGYTVIKPIPKPVKKNWLKIEAVIDNGPDFHDSATNLLADLKPVKVTPDQAQAIAAMLEAAMAYVQGGDVNDQIGYNATANKARAALQED